MAKEIKEYPHRVDLVAVEIKIYSVLQTLQNGEYKEAQALLTDELIPLIRTQQDNLANWKDILWAIPNKI